jgi:hypothetical protein
MGDKYRWEMRAVRAASKWSNRRGGEVVSGLVWGGVQVSEEAPCSWGGTLRNHQLGPPLLKEKYRGEGSDIGCTS